MNWVGLWTLTSREVGRFFSVYRQTIIPGLTSSILYILIFGFTLERRIAEINGVPYTLFIIPGLIMMNTLTNAFFKFILLYAPNETFRSIARSTSGTVIQF